MLTFGVSSVSRLSGREENCWPGWMESVFFVALIVVAVFSFLWFVLFCSGWVRGSVLSLFLVGDTALLLALKLQ